MVQNIEKIPFGKLSEIMRKYNQKFPENQYSPKLSGVIVYKAENWEKPYTLEQRSYRVYNSNRCFQAGKIANSLSGYCLDGKDVGVRLDWYNWKVEYCYME